MYIPEDLICDNPTCKGAELEYVDGGTVLIGKRSIGWTEYICPVCGETFSNEPDWDSLPGGKNYE